MADNLAAVIALAVALSSPVLVLSITRPRPMSWRGQVGLFAEVFATVVVATIIVRLAAIPALQWLSVRLP